MGFKDKINSALENAGLKKKAVYVVLTKSDGSTEVITKEQLHKAIQQKVSVM